MVNYNTLLITMTEFTSFDFLPYAACSITFFVLGYSLKWFLNTISKGSEENPTDNGLVNDVDNSTLNTPTNLINQPVEESTADLIITTLQNQIEFLQNTAKSLHVDITFCKDVLRDVLTYKMSDLGVKLTTIIPKEHWNKITPFFKELSDEVGAVWLNHEFCQWKSPHIEDNNMHSVIESFSYNLEYTYISYFVIIIFFIVIYFIIYKILQIKISITSLFFFLCNCSILTLFFFGFYNIHKGMSNPIYIENLSVFSAYRSLLLLFLSIITLCYYFISKYVFPESTNQTFITFPYLKQQMHEIIYSIKRTKEIFNIFMTFLYKNINRIFYATLHFFIFYVIRIIHFILFFNFMFFHGDLRWNLYLLPISFTIWILRFFEYSFNIYIEGSNNYIRSILQVTPLKDLSYIEEEFITQELTQLKFEITAVGHAEGYNDDGLYILKDIWLDLA
jgi:hypothetical protein